MTPDSGTRPAAELTKAQQQDGPTHQTPKGNPMSTDDFTRAAGNRDWAAYERELQETELNGAGLFEVNGDDPNKKFITNIRRLAGNARTPGSRVIASATWALFLLGAGLLYVSLNAQYHDVLNVKHESIPAMIEAMSPDGAMIILSALAIGLAMAGKSSKAERFLIVTFAALAAFMNYAPADPHSWRSVAAYIAPPIVLAVITDRVISVVRRYVLPDDSESAWKPLGKALAFTAKAMVLIVLYSLRTVLAPRETTKGLRRMVLDAAPVPGMVVAEVIEIEPQEEIEHGENDGIDLAPVFPTKKAAFLSLYRGHEAYGSRDKAAAAAAELAPQAGLQPGTGRTYVIEELRRLAAIEMAQLNGSN